MNKTELINKLLQLGSTMEICNSTQTSKKAKELAHNLLDNYLEAINYTHCCESDSEQLQAVEDLKEFARNNCREWNVEEMEDIIDRL